MPAGPAAPRDLLLGLAASVLAVALLAVASRGAPAGTMVADDYDYLYALRFGGLHLFDALGAAVYWRPLSRQLYVGMLGDALLAAPWLAVAIHAALLVAIGVGLFALARRALPTGAAAAVATFPLLAEPMRVLYVWPSGVQYLLAMALSLGAIHLAFAGRLWASALVAGAAALSHELGALALAAAPFAAWRRGQRGTPLLRSSAPVAVVLALLAAGQLAAARHGVAQPGATEITRRLLSIPELLMVALTAQLNAEDLAAPVRLACWAAYAAIAFTALALFATSAATRARLRSVAPWGWAGVAWFVIAAVPLVLMLPGWNAWRTTFASLGLGLAAIAVLSAAWRPLVAALVAVRLVALLAAAPAPAMVERTVPPSTSDLSFARVARLQRIVGSTRAALRAHGPALPHGARARHWVIPNVALIGFAGPRAVRTWYGDSTITWENYGDAEMDADGAPGADVPDVLVAYDTPSADPAVVIERDAVRALVAARVRLGANRPRAADSLIALAAASQPRPSRTFEDVLCRHGARAALARGDIARADSLNERSWAIAGESLQYRIVSAYVALARGDRATAAGAVRRALEIAPDNPEARWLAGQMSPER